MLKRLISGFTKRRWSYTSAAVLSTSVATTADITPPSKIDADALYLIPHADTPKSCYLSSMRVNGDHYLGEKTASTVAGDGFLFFMNGERSGIVVDSIAEVAVATYEDYTCKDGVNPVCVTSKMNHKIHLDKISNALLKCIIRKENSRA